MAKAVQKIRLSASRDIPFNQLILSQANVRRIKAGVSIEELAADIARRTLLQSITVRPVLDETGAETGMFEVPAGGRRYRALELLVQRKRLSPAAPVPCVVRTEGIAEEDSLAENVQRAPLHPLDQQFQGPIAAAAGRDLEHAGLSAGLIEHRPDGEALQQGAPSDVRGQLLNRDAGLDAPHVRLREDQLIERDVARGA